MIKEDSVKIAGWQRILLIVIPYFVVVGVFQLTGMLITQTPLNQINEHHFLFKDLINTFFNGLGTFLIILLFVKYVDNDKFIKIGLSLSKRSNEIVFALLISLISVGGGFFIILNLDQIEIVKFNFDLQKVTMSIFLFGIIAFSEEILFRGYVLKNLMLSFGKFTSLMVSSCIFVLAHCINPNFNWISVFSLFLSGIALGLSYVYTKNLWFPISLHFGWNLFQTYLGFNVSGQNSYSIIETTIMKSNFLNGGEFGFEGSIFSLIFEIFIIVVVFRYFYKKGNHENINPSYRIIDES